MTDKQEIVLNTLKSLDLNNFGIMELGNRLLIDFKIEKELTIRMYRVRLFQNGSIHIREYYIYSEFGTVHSKDIFVNYRFRSVNYFIESLKEKI